MMGFAVKFNDCVDRYNILKTPTIQIANFFDKYPTVYKITLIINHLFRAAAMVGLMFIPGIPKLPGMAICFVGYLFYRLTVEKNCAYKFALPAFAGAAAFMLALPAIINIINGLAFTTASSGFLACASLIPLPLYAAYILLTVSYDVDKTLGQRSPNEAAKASCCQPSQKKSQEPEKRCYCEQPSV